MASDSSPDAIGSGINYGWDFTSIHIAVPFVFLGLKYFHSFHITMYFQKNTDLYLGKNFEYLGGHDFML